MIRALYHTQEDPSKKLRAVKEQNLMAIYLITAKSTHITTPLRGVQGFKMFSVGIPRSLNAKPLVAFAVFAFAIFSFSVLSFWASLVALFAWHSEILVRFYEGP